MIFPGVGFGQCLSLCCCAAGVLLLALLLCCWAAAGAGDGAVLMIHPSRLPCPWVLTAAGARPPQGHTGDCPDANLAADPHSKHLKPHASHRHMLILPLYRLPHAMHMGSRVVTFFTLQGGPGCGCKPSWVRSLIQQLACRKKVHCNGCSNMLRNRGATMATAESSREAAMLKGMMLLLHRAAKPRC